MGLRIMTNIPSLAAQRYLGRNNDAQNRTLEKLASGQRINRAGDDAAGLAISEKLKANIRSLKQATRNANDGVSMIQTAEGAMNEVSNILIRLRELSIQGASDTIGQNERGFLDKEVQQLKSEINRISGMTEFNGIKLLDGSQNNLEIQVGVNNNAFLDRFNYDTQSAKISLESLGLLEVGTTTKESAQQNLANLDVAINRVNENRSTLGALQNRLQSAINNMQIYNENLAQANSRIRDADIAEETSDLTKNNIMTQASVAVLGQANASTQAALKLLG